ncbi:MAG: hypothetical protein DI551_07320 [Micavibrio aeruginosavorus]|jgi:hypothetical protein|uniref:CopG family transcriptional regulator n=1 Tax=Micavibrio aeruginosavorus TaxID=349221 RepID=A0A2W5MZ96_9BACT|nr:MAG: hypothetical protein DI551_07320 [Micavibrio aeruginosavorus]
MAKTEKRVQKTIQWDADVWTALEDHNKRSRLNNMSAAANDAVRFALFPEFRSDREKDMVKLMQDIRASLYEHRKATARDLMILQEGFFQFVEEFFQHTHSIPKNELAAAKAQAKARLKEFMEQLVQKAQDPKRKTQEKE